MGERPGSPRERRPRSSTRPVGLCAAATRCDPAEIAREAGVPSRPLSPYRFEAVALFACLDAAWGALRRAGEDALEARTPRAWMSALSERFSSLRSALAVATSGGPHRVRRRADVRGPARHLLEGNLVEACSGAAISALCRPNGTRAEAGIFVASACDGGHGQAGGSAGDSSDPPALARLADRN